MFGGCRVGQEVKAVGTFLAKADGVLAGLAVADLVGTVSSSAACIFVYNRKRQLRRIGCPE